MQLTVMAAGRQPSGGIGCYPFSSELKVVNFPLLLSVRRTENRINDKKLLQKCPETLSGSYQKVAGSDREVRVHDKLVSGQRNCVKQLGCYEETDTSEQLQAGLLGLN